MIEWTDNKKLEKDSTDIHTHHKVHRLCLHQVSILCLHFSLVWSCFPAKQPSWLGYSVKCARTWPRALFLCCIYYYTFAQEEECSYWRGDLTCSNEAVSELVVLTLRVLPVTQCVSIEVLASWWMRFWKSSKL